MIFGEIWLSDIYCILLWIKNTIYNVNIVYGLSVWIFPEMIFGETGISAKNMCSFVDFSKQLGYHRTTWNIVRPNNNKIPLGSSQFTYESSEIVVAIMISRTISAEYNQSIFVESVFTWCKKKRPKRLTI